MPITFEVAARVGVTVTEWDGTPLESSTTVAAFIPRGAAWGFGAQPQAMPRPDRPALIERVTVDGRTVPLVLLPKPGADSETFRRNITDWFDPGQSTADRYLGVNIDGEPLRLACRVTSLQPLPDAPLGYQATLVAVNPYFEHQTERTATPGTIVLTGTARTQPVITIAPAATATWYRASYSDPTSSSAGLVGMLARLQGAGFSATKTYVIINRQSVPFDYVSATELWVRLNVPAGGSATVDVVTSTALPDNPLADRLDTGGVTAYGGGTGNAVIDTGNPSTRPDVPLAWRPILLGGRASGMSISSEATPTFAIDTTSDDTSTANGVQTVVPTGASQITLTRTLSVTASAGTAYARIYERARGSATWVVASSVSATSSAAVTLTADTVAIAVVLQVSNDFAGTASLSLGDATILMSRPNAAATQVTTPALGIYDGTLTNAATGQTVTFGDLVAPSPLVIDARYGVSERGIRQSSSGPFFTASGGSLALSDPTHIFSLLPGSNSVSGFGTTSLIFREAYS